MQRNRLFVQADHGLGGASTLRVTVTLAFLTTPGSYLPFYPGVGGYTGFVDEFDLAEAASAQIIDVANAASFVAGNSGESPDGAVAPGEIVTVFGTGIPANPKLTFDGHPASILNSEAQQINAVVPFEVTTIAVQ